VEVDFSLEAEVPALPKKGTASQELWGFLFFTPKCFTKKGRYQTYENCSKTAYKKEKKYYLGIKFEFSKN
jgi:hypothetical protein